MLLMRSGWRPAELAGSGMVRQMPYKVSGKRVMVFKAGKWSVLHTHASHAKALKQLAALRIHASK